MAVDMLEKLLEHWGCRSSATSRGAVLVPRQVMEQLAALALGRLVLDERRYLQLNPDVYAAVKAGHVQNALQHAVWDGVREGRPLPDAVVNGGVYGDLNPDLRAQGIESPEALASHWLAVGWIEGRRREGGVGA